jgi:hypothetical protein
MTIPILNSEQLLTTQRKRTPILDRYLSEEELAEQLKVKRSTLARWRRLQIGPAFSRKGKAPIYHEESVERWLRDGGTEVRRSRKRGPP